jgi:hypothetical protein
MGYLLLGLLYIVLLLIVTHSHHLHHFPNSLLVYHVLLLELKLVFWVLGLELRDIVVTKLRQKLWLLHLRLGLLLLVLGWGHEVDAVMSGVRCL